MHQEQKVNKRFFSQLIPFEVVKRMNGPVLWRSSGARQACRKPRKIISLFQYVAFPHGEIVVTAPRLVARLSGLLGYLSAPRRQSCPPKLWRQCGERLRGLRFRYRPDSLLRLYGR
jgi:hypothetical protein